MIVLGRAQGAVAMVMFGAPLLGACEENHDAAHMGSATSQATMLVLARGPRLLTQEPTTFEFPRETVVAGTDIAVCLVVRGGVSAPPSSNVAKVIREATADAKLSATVEYSDGVSVPLARPIFQWDLHGKVMGDGEVALCVGPKCGVEPPAKGSVERVVVTTTKHFTANGAYFRSQQWGNADGKAGSPKVGCSG
jgi:hypothetical protein